MLVRNIAGLSSMLLLCVAGALAQWTPVTAHIREKTEILKAGKVVRTEEVREGVYLRSSDGSTLTHWTRVNGVDVPGEGDLLNNTTLHSYTLDYKTKTARQGQFDLTEPLQQHLYSQVTSLGQDSVAGLSCKVIPVSRKESATAPIQRYGQACVSVEYGLLLKKETNYPNRDGSVIHYLSTMYDIQLNVEPDAKEFDVERSFNVSKPTQTRAMQEGRDF